MSTDDDYEGQALIESNQLTEQQLQSFYYQVERQPAKRAPVSGQVCRLLFEFMEDTGLRITEALHVQKKDIDLNTRIITVTHPKSERQCKCSTWRYADLLTRKRVLESADPNCINCHGKGRWKKPQRTTITPRIVFDLSRYLEQLDDDDMLFLGTRQSYYNWAKAAGEIAGINIFQQKDEKLIKGVFLHLFRALCSKRMTSDSKNDKFQNQILDVKMRHGVILRDRYNRVDINYLLAWEQRQYITLAQKLKGLDL